MKKKNMFVRGVIVFIILLGSCSRNMKKEGLVFQNENGDSFRLLFKGDSVFIFNIITFLIFFENAGFVNPRCY